MDRRTFLRNAALTSGAAMLGSTALSSCWWGQGAGGGLGAGPPGPGGRNMLEFAASSWPVQRVVLVMMENRSFDHWLGWMANDEAYLEAGRSAYGADFTIDGAVHQTYPGPNGPVATAHMLDQLAAENPWRGCGHPDPGHGWNPGRAQRDGGFLAAGSGNDQFALGYYEGADLPFTGQLAKRFCTFDRYHASVLGPTYPNREYLHSGQSGGNKSNTLPPTTTASSGTRSSTGSTRPASPGTTSTPTSRSPRSGARACCRSRRRSTTSSSAAPTARCPRCRSSTPGSWPGAAPTTTPTATSAPARRSSGTSSRRSHARRTGATGCSSSPTTSGAASSTTCRRRSSPTIGPARSTPTTSARPASGCRS